MQTNNARILYLTLQNEQWYEKVRKVVHESSFARHK